MGRCWVRSAVSALSRAPPLELKSRHPLPPHCWPRSCESATYYGFCLCSSWRPGSLDPHRVELLKIFAWSLHRASVSRLSLLWWTSFQVLLEVFTSCFLTSFFSFFGVCVCVCVCCIYMFIWMGIHMCVGACQVSSLIVPYFIS